MTTAEHLPVTAHWPSEPRRLVMEDLSGNETAVDAAWFAWGCRAQETMEGEDNGDE